jgi:hypothetical protein
MRSATKAAADVFWQPSHVSMPGLFQSSYPLLLSNSLYNAVSPRPFPGRRHLFLSQPRIGCRVDISAGWFCWAFDDSGNSLNFGKFRTIDFFLECFAGPNGARCIRALLSYRTLRWSSLAFPPRSECRHFLDRCMGNRGHGASSIRSDQ